MLPRSAEIQPLFLRFVTLLAGWCSRVGNGPGEGGPSHQGPPACRFPVEGPGPARTGRNARTALPPIDRHAWDWSRVGWQRLTRGPAKACPLGLAPGPPPNRSSQFHPPPSRSVQPNSSAPGWAAPAQAGLPPSSPPAGQGIAIGQPARVGSDSALAPASRWGLIGNRFPQSVGQPSTAGLIGNCPGQTVGFD